jgi:hypothetical protein
VIGRSFLDQCTTWRTNAAPRSQRTGPAYSTDGSDAMLLEFLQTTYEAAANAADWDRAALEYGPGGPRPMT